MIVRCLRCRLKLAADDYEFHGRPLIYSVIKSHMHSTHNMDIDIDRAMNYVVVIREPP